MKEFKSFWKQGAKPKKHCSVDGCTRPIFSKNKCRTHWGYEYQKKQVEKKKSQNIDDAQFYIDLFTKAVIEDRWVCLECGINLPTYDLSDDDLSFKIRNFMHHCAPKNKYEQFRHLEKNIVFLCYRIGCDAHSVIEHSVNKDKLKCFKIIEEIKNNLINK